MTELLRYYCPKFQVVLQRCINNTNWYWHKNRHVNHWNRIEDMIMPPMYGLMVFDKEAKSTHWKEEGIFNKWCWSKLPFFLLSFQYIFGLNFFVLLIFLYLPVLLFLFLSQLSINTVLIVLFCFIFSFSVVNT